MRVLQVAHNSRSIALKGTGTSAIGYGTVGGINDMAAKLELVVPVYLLHEELVAITGYKRKSKQVAWLKAHKIQHQVNGFGHPIVGRRYWEESCGIPKRQTPQNTPNWAAMGR